MDAEEQDFLNKLTEIQKIDGCTGSKLVFNGTAVKVRDMTELEFKCMRLDEIEILEQIPACKIQWQSVMEDLTGVVKVWRRAEKVKHELVIPPSKFTKHRLPTSDWLRWILKMKTFVETHQIGIGIYLIQMTLDWYITTQVYFPLFTIDVAHANPKYSALLNLYLQGKTVRLGLDLDKDEIYRKLVDYLGHQIRVMKASENDGVRVKVFDDSGDKRVSSLDLFEKGYSIHKVKEIPKDDIFSRVILYTDTEYHGHIVKADLPDTITSWKNTGQIVKK